MEVAVGVVGWDYPEWRGLIYGEHAKASEFLRQYAEHFRIVESAASYYGMPKTDTVATWAAETPPGFVISLKVPDWIVRKKTDDPDLAGALATFLRHLEPLAQAKKLGTLVAQFHPSYRFDKKADDLARFVAKLPEGPSWAIELRDPSWWREETYKMLSDRGIALVWSDLGDLRTPEVVTTDRLYLRLFGDRVLEPPYDKKRRDARSTLEHWANAIRTAAPAVARVDVLVSKYLEGYAPESARTMMELLGVQAPRAKQLTLDDLR